MKLINLIFFMIFSHSLVSQIILDSTLSPSKYVFYKSIMEINNGDTISQNKTYIWVHESLAEGSIKKIVMKKLNDSSFHINSEFYNWYSLTDSLQLYFKSQIISSKLCNYINEIEKTCNHRNEYGLKLFFYNKNKYECEYDFDRDYLLLSKIIQEALEFNNLLQPQQLDKKKKKKKWWSR